MSWEAGRLCGREDRGLGQADGDPKRLCLRAETLTAKRAVTAPLKGLMSLALLNSDGASHSTQSPILEQWFVVEVSDERACNLFMSHGSREVPL